MATIGGVVETKEVGLSIGTGGTHNGTVYDAVNGYITLNSTEKDGNNLPVYKEEGFWISDVIQVEDNFKSYQKVFTTHTDKGDVVDNSLSSIKIQTRVSKDNVTWDDWVDTELDGTIKSVTTWQETLGDGTIKTHIKKYIQVKIIFKAGFVTDVYLISEFNNEADADLFDSEFIETSNGLRLKREYVFDMIKDVTWTDTGSLHKHTISKADIMRIDSLKVINKVV